MKLKQYVKIKDRTDLSCGQCKKITSQKLILLHVDYGSNSKPYIRLIFECSCGWQDGGNIEGESIEMTINL